MFAGLELQAQFAAGATDPHAALGHYGAMTALAATIAAAAVIGSSSLPGAAFGGWLGVGAAVAFGVASILFPESASSLGVVFGLALTTAAVALGAGLRLTRGSNHAIDRAPEPQRAT